jgi:hypothetical protein
MKTTFVNKHQRKKQVERRSLKNLIMKEKKKRNRQINL